MKVFLRLALFLAGTTIAFSQQMDLLRLMPYPKAAFQRTGSFAISSSTALVLADSISPATRMVADFLQQKLKAVIGSTLPEKSQSSYTGGMAIILGERNANAFMSQFVEKTSPYGENAPDTGGYVLDINPQQILVAGTNSEGTFNGVKTLLQLLNASGGSASVQGAHIWDAPDYPDRWVFSQHNLRATTAIPALRAIADTMALYKINGIQQGDFKYAILQTQPQSYRDTVAAFRLMTEARGISIIPGVAGIGYSDGILYNDPDLAEGCHAYAVYHVESDTGRLIPDPRVALPNGGFEQVDANGKFTGWSYYDGTDNPNVTFDKAVVHGGMQSVRCSNFRTGQSLNSGNCRFERTMPCQTNRYYNMSAWIKTQDFQAGEVQLLALGTDANKQSRGLTFTQYSIPATTNGWMRVEVSFNTLNSTSVNLYCGVWDGQAGTIWFDDFSVQEAGLTDILRRAGTPLTVSNKNTGRVYIEGTDYAPVVDQIMESAHGSYGPYHQAPALRRIPGGAIANGDSLLVSYYHPLTTVSDDKWNGSVMVCVSEDTLYRIIGRGMAGVDSFYHPANFFFGHDEIRSMNWDSSCQERHMNPAELLSDNVIHCKKILDSIHPDARAFMWSDMFDSLHNAYNNYYLVNGDLTGDWNTIPKDITIVNWNGQKLKQSLQKFSDLGFQQMTAPYFDSRNSSTIRNERIAQEGISGITGMQYTTWALDYDFLRPFSYYAWGAGPYIIHTPVSIDTAEFGNSGGQYKIQAIILPDPFDPADAIVSVTGKEGDGVTMMPFTMTSDSANHYTATITGAFDQYEFTATNKQGLTRTVRYATNAGRSAVPSDNTVWAEIALSVSPNISATTTRVRFTTAPGAWSIALIDMLGRTVLEREGSGNVHEQHVVSLDLTHIPAGAYRCVVQTSKGMASSTVTVVR